jgi:hypothetical protein
MTMAAPLARTIVDLDADATILDAARRLDAAEPDADVVVVVPAGAPLARNVVFFEVLRRHAAGRRLAVVSPDARARSLAAAVHLRAFAGLAALERRELDPTERLTETRRAALATIALEGARPRISPRRTLAVAVSLVVAAAVLLAVVAPYAIVTVAPSSTPIGPLEYDLRAGPEGDIPAQTQTAPITGKVTGPATGSRTEESKAVGLERFTNLTTADIRIPIGTVVRTSDNIFFQTTEEKVLPRSVLVPFLISQVQIAIVAIDPGPKGNVAADRITSGSSSQYSVTNPAPTAGGDSKKIPVVTQSDYDAAAAKAERELELQGAAQLETWKRSAPKDTTIWGTFVQRKQLTPPAEVVGKDASTATFDLVVSGTATAYAVASSEPKHTAVARLRATAPSENDVDEASAVAESVVDPTVGADGVRWRIRVRAQQSARVNRAQLSAALAGKPFADTAVVAAERGVRVRRMGIWPGWWPRMPLLDSRISVEVETPAATGLP